LLKVGPTGWGLGVIVSFEEHSINKGIRNRLVINNADQLVFFIARVLILTICTCKSLIKVKLYKSKNLVPYKQSKCQYLFFACEL